MLELSAAQPGTPWCEDYEPEIATFHEHEKDVVRRHFQSAWCQNSTVLGIFVGNLKTLLMHGHAIDKAQAKRNREQAPEKRAAERAAQDVQRAANAAVWAEWQNQCRQRNEWIQGLDVEWRARVEQRRKAVEQWDAFVEQARDAVRAARAVPAPLRPDVSK